MTDREIKAAPNIEIEWKHLVLNYSYKNEALRHSHIVQGYICSDGAKGAKTNVFLINSFFYWLNNYIS